MLTLLAVLALQAQVADTSPFRALPLPAANRVRSASGTPGPDYWQQRADYVIRATLDTAGSVIHGSERIHYENHSPDPLAFVWVQIEQNIFAKNSVTYALNQPPLHFAGGAVFDFTGKGFIGGITIERFRAAGRELARTEYGTMMRVELPRPLAPHGAIDFEVAWHFPVPPYGGGRMGRIGTRLYEIGQWYPRMVVYDDVHGWNPLPYIGAGEFYLEYGDFDVTLTLPAGFVELCRTPWRCGARPNGHGWPAREPPPSASKSSRKRRQPRTALSAPRAPRAGNFGRPACATSPGPPRPTSGGTPPAGTAS